MNIIDAFKRELKNEYEITKKFLNHYPEDKNDWAPHEKSMKLKDLTHHTVELFAWPVMVFNSDHIDFAKRPEKEDISTAQGFHDFLDKAYNQSVSALENAKEEDLGKAWQMRAGDTVLNEMSKYDSFALNIRHLVHHRAQMGVYYRLNDVFVPSTIGPSADDK